VGTFGGYAPFPRRFGGRATRVKTITASLQTQLGKKYDTTDTTGLVFIRLNAMAREIAAAWGQNQRLANQWDAKRMTDFLPRWEKILGLYASPGDSPTARRARVGVQLALVGESTSQVIHDTCVAYLGPVFVSVVTTPSTSANVWTPTGWPMGQHPITITLPGGRTVFYPGDWYSTVAHIDILTVQPATMGDAEYYSTRASVKSALDSILPSWVTFDIVRDGPHGIGFYLDEPHNLDNERFS